ncbi:divergent polysaccharide deacetylase family protein [Cypionkella sp.]|uniref:divergent polysaccharide deacetylase family protein n=1 Tax=Cypionkella sp. TaxID=2811411 RepID=UPI002AB9EB5D|nr:divergent polysaccharide deacetylase family protein [Cypionkella sp.]MDZ4392486.1 divergent polysaccharide deacetylase family protein [Cypionkella sp.]
MIRNFVTGIVVGGVVAGAGLAVVSQLSPLPTGGAEVAVGSGAVAELPKSVQPEAAPAVEPETAVAPAPEAAVVPEAAAAEPAAVPSEAPATAVPDAPAKPATDEPVSAEPEGVAPEAVKPAPAPPETSAEAPAELNNPGSDATAPQVQAQPDAAPIAAAPALLPTGAGTDAAPSKADLPPPAPAEAAETLMEPTPAPAPVTPGMLVLDPAPEPAPMAEPDPEAAALPKLLDTDQPEGLVPSEGLTNSVDGVTVGRLPRISAEEPAAEAEAALAPVDSRPLAQFAASFSNDLGKPVFAVLLVDTGAADLDRAALAALPFPVSFVIDPLDPGATAAEAIYRAAGKEVVMLAAGIPEGATASDLEQTFQANAGVLPQAVAVMDIGAAGFQDNRPLATMVVPIIKDQGRGLVTFDAGLNAADQVARREDVPAAVIFRDLDAAGEDTPLIRRYLDRAAFKAAQEGRVVVVGTTRPETIAALMEWSIEGRGASVALAPISAALAVK